jgi:hypothetical protein
MYTQNHEGCKAEAEKCCISMKHDRFKASNAKKYNGQESIQ